MGALSLHVMGSSGPVTPFEVAWIAEVVVPAESAAVMAECVAAEVVYVAVAVLAVVA